MKDFEKLYSEDRKILINKVDAEYLKKYFEKKRGWVYLAKSPDNVYCKVGRTKKNPIQRAKSLSSTGVFNDYEILFALPCLNSFWVEKKIHKEMQKYNIKKEFFMISENQAKECIIHYVEEEDKLLSRFLDVNMVKEDLYLIKEAIL